MTNQAKTCTRPSYPEGAKCRPPRSAPPTRARLRRLSLSILFLGVMSVGAAACTGSSTPSGVGPYQQMVRAFCSRLHAEDTNVHIRTMVNADGVTVVQSSDIISAARTVLSDEKDEYSTLVAQSVPASLVPAYNNVRKLDPELVAAQTDEVNAVVRRLPQGSVTEAQIDQAAGPQESQVQTIGTQLNDAMAALAGSSCPVVDTADTSQTTTQNNQVTPTTNTSGPTTTSLRSAPPSTTAPGQFIPDTSSVDEFYSPSQNISCEIDYGFTEPDSPSVINNVLCLTISPPQSVHMSIDGSLDTCSGVQCLSNAGLNTPTLAYGDSTGVGPFLCTSAMTGMTCTVTGGKGFTISRAGITPLDG